MAYISIIDLPELQNAQITGEEYLLVTNSNLDSNKIKMNSMSDYLTKDISDNLNGSLDTKINTSVNTAVSNALKETKVTIFDEGIEVGSVNKINFIGATVNSFISDDINTADIYIPSASITSHFNTVDGITNSKVNNAVYELRYISQNFDENDFVLGDWVSGTLKPCVSENISYIVSDFIYIDLDSIFKFYIIQNGIIKDQLEINSNDGIYSSNNIEAIITNKTKELNHHKCKLTFSFKLKNFINGRFQLKAEYIGKSGSFIFLENEMFFDNNNTAAEISSSITFKNVINKFLSGVKYIGNNSTIEINTILYNAKNLTFPNNICDIDGTNCGLSTYNINVADLNLSDFYFNTDLSFSKNYTILNNKFYNSTMFLKSRVNDWNKGSYLNTNFYGLVDTYTDNSTRIYEDFVSETNRLNSAFTQFNSTNVLSNIDLQIYNSKLVYPQLDFSSFYNNPNYLNLTGDRCFIRKFWHSNVSHSNGLFGIISNIKEEDLNTKVKIEISLDSINWYNCCSDYIGGTLINGNGCRINSDTNSLNINNKIEFTLGLNKFTNSTSNWGIYIKITFLDAAKDKYIDVLQITNW